MRSVFAIHAAVKREAGMTSNSHFFHVSLLHALHGTSQVYFDILWLQLAWPRATSWQG